MNNTLLSAAVALIAACALVPTAAQAERSIDTQQLGFSKGRSGATVKGSVTGDSGVDYKLRARAGQTLKVKIRGGKVTPYFNVLPPGSSGEAIFIGSRDGDEATLTLSADGEYTIRVYQMGRAKTSARRTDFVLEVSIPAGAEAAGGGDPLGNAAQRAGAGKFDATGKLPCAQAPAQPMGQCSFGVARAGVGTAVVAVTLPDGRTRMLMFSDGKATGADLSQADGDTTFRATKEADLFKIQAGKERYEMPDAVITGG
jgi:hypothetical protein